MLNKILNVPSKMVAERMQSCEVVLWALRTHGHQMAELLGGKYSPHLEEGQVMPFEIELAIFQKELIQLRDVMHSAERTNRTQKAQETQSRRLQDAVIVTVNVLIARLRRLFSSAYDDDQLAEAGFARINARQPEELLEQAAYLAVRLRQPDLEFSDSHIGNFEVEASTLAPELEPLVEDLRQKLSELHREVRLTEASQQAKNEAMDEFNHGFLWIARSVESKLQLAGMEELAARVRPSSRRPGVTERKPELPEAQDDEQQAEGAKSTAAESTTPSEAQSAES